MDQSIFSLKKPLSPADLSDYPFAFCESLQALDAARAAGLSKHARILTRSPALLARQDPPCVHLDSRWTFSRSAMDAFFLGTRRFLEECQEILLGDAVITRFAVVTCREIWNWQQRALFAALLNEDDYVEPRLVIDAVPRDGTPVGRFRLPWGSLLAPNPQLGWVEAEVDLSQDRPLRTSESLIDRLRINSADHFLWRLAQRFWERVPASLNARRFLFLKESEVVREVGLAFARRGYLVAQLKLPSGPSPDRMHPLAERIVGKLRARLMDRMELLGPAMARTPLLNDLRNALSTHLHAYDAAMAHLEAHGPGLMPRGSSAIVSNYPYGGAACAVADYARSKGVPFAGVQHGVGRELLNAPQNQCNYENTMAPFALMFNETARALTEKGQFRRPESDVVAVGLPRDYSRVGKRSVPVRGANAMAPILYVQMLARTGSFFNGGIYKDDWQSFEDESSVVRNVLERLPHKVAFKPYPHASNVDLDPIFSIIKDSRNVELMQTGRDLRYVISNVRIVVTIGTSSTLGWCLFSGKPVVYVDPRPLGYRLSPDVLEKYPNAFFYFDSLSDTFHDDLRAALSRQLEDIEAEWDAGEAAREEFRNTYFGISDGRTGRRAYSWMKAKMQELRRA